MSGPRESARGTGATRDQIFERLRSRASCYLNTPATAECDVREVGHRAGGRTGTVRLFRLGGERSARWVLTKTYSPSGMEGGDPERMHRPYRREVAALKELGELLPNHERYRLPRLLDAWDDLNTLVVERVDGAPAAEMIRQMIRTPGSRAEKQRSVRRVYAAIGGWLAFLHSATYAGRGGLDSDRVAQLKRRVEDALASRGLLQAKIGRRIVRSAERLVAVVGRAGGLPTFPIARCHGDYSLSNVMVGPGGEVWGVDVSGRWVEPVYVDLTRFLVMSRTSRRSAWAGKARRRFDRSFLIGYSREARFKLEGRRAGLRVCAVYSYLLRLAQLLEARAADGGSRWARGRRWLEREWVRVKYVWPMEALIESASERRREASGRI